MADRVLFIGWNRPVVGREQQAMKLFQKAMGKAGRWFKEKRDAGSKTTY
jgi:hypothetical protein